MYEPVEIKWRDSQRYTSQMNVNDEMSIVTIMTVGWLIEKRHDEVILAQDIIDEDIRGVIAIPKENVVSMVKLLSK